MESVQARYKIYAPCAAGAHTEAATLLRRRGQGGAAPDATKL
jgi:hypothetical protein